MPIYAPSDTLEALGGGLLKNCESRSLFQSRFADPQPKDDKDRTPRKDWFHAFLKRNPQGASSLDWLPSNSEQLYARLMSRMMIDMSGGIMENANVLLDRYGLPYIPGSAVKGCARRMALQALHDWIQAQETPGSEERPAEDDACAPCCKDFKTPAEMLAAIARIFGWVEKDWEAGKKEDGLFCSDFGWACGEDCGGIWKQAAQLLCESFHWEFTDEVPWKTLPNFAGAIAFLEAKPNEDPGLELDVLTPHHKTYYSPEPDKSKERKKWEEWNAYRSAPDTEDPEPIFFPAVKPQHGTDFFTFPLIPLSRVADSDLSIAKNWLANGLEIFGIGAKTAAGYGWFDASKSIQKAIKEIQEESRKRARKEAERKAEEEKKAREDELRRKRKEAEAKALDGRSPEEQEDWKIGQLSDQQLENKLRNFFKEVKKGGPADSEKPAIIRALKGPRLEHWKQFKAKATKGDLARAAADIHALNKKLYGDKMP